MSTDVNKSIHYRELLKSIGPQQIKQSALSEETQGIDAFCTGLEQKRNVSLKT